MSSIAPATNPQETDGTKLDSVVAAGKKCRRTGSGWKIRPPPLMCAPRDALSDTAGGGGYPLVWGWRMPG